MKWDWWRGILEDTQTKLASHAKLNAIIGAVVASWIMVREAIHDRMNSEYFWAYLGVLVSGAALSKWIGFRDKMKGNKNDSSDVDIPKS